MPYRKYIKKATKKAVGFAKKRYTTRTGGARVNKLAKDLYAVKRALNVEHKHYDFQFGSGKAISSQVPTKQTPIIIPLPLPTRGVGFNNRIGNQIKITHITSKLQFVFNNNTDLIQRTTAVAQIIFAKSVDDIPSIDELYLPDANGHITPMSFTNVQEYKKFLWLKGLKSQKSYTQPTNRYPLSNLNADTLDPTHGATWNIDVETPSATHLNHATFYVNKQATTNIRVFFQNGSEVDVAQMKPYLVLRSDVIEGATPETDYDPIGITGQIRFTYVDN